MLAILITTVAGATIALIAQALPKDEPHRKRRHSVRHYRAVSIVPGRAGCCAACEALGRKRFLLREAPRLPLPECTAKECNCHYRHHTDRRAYNPGRRNRDVGERPAPFEGSERRLWDVNRRHRRQARSLSRA